MREKKTEDEKLNPPESGGSVSTKHELTFSGLNEHNLKERNPREKKLDPTMWTKGGEDKMTGILGIIE